MYAIDNGASLDGTRLANLKREIFFFEKMVLVNLSVARKAWEKNTSEELKEWNSDIEFMLDSPFFIEQDMSHICEDCPWGNEGSEFKYLIEQFTKISHENSIDRENDSAEISAQQQDLICRFLLQAARRQVPDMTLAYDPYRKESNRTTASATDIIQLAVEHVPVPDPIMPWEDIILLKCDEEFIEKSRKLLIWANDLSSRNISLHLAEEYILDAISDYENYMKAVGVKYTTSGLSAILVQSAEIIEDLAKLRVGKVAGRLLQVRSRQADLALAELAAPGRPLALVSALKREFGPRRS